MVRGEKASVALEQEAPGFGLEALGQGNPQATSSKVEKLQLILVGRSPSKNHNNGHDEMKSWEVLVLWLKCNLTSRGKCRAGFVCEASAEQVQQELGS